MQEGLTNPRELFTWFLPDHPDLKCDGITALATVAQGSDVSCLGALMKFRQQMVERLPRESAENRVVRRGKTWSLGKFDGSCAKVLKTWSDSFDGAISHSGTNASSLAMQEAMTKIGKPMMSQATVAPFSTSFNHGVGPPTIGALQAGR